LESVASYYYKINVMVDFESYRLSNALFDYGLFPPTRNWL